MKNNKGFTLIEMLIVVAIIAILSGVVLAGVSNFQSRARDTRRIGDMKNIQNYLELYFNKCGHYPGGVDASGNCTTTAPTDWPTLTSTMTGGTNPVTSKFPQEQVASRAAYCYGVSSDQLKYVVGAVLENDNNVLHGTENSAVPSGITPFGSCTTVNGGSLTYWVSS